MTEVEYLQRIRIGYDCPEAMLAALSFEACRQYISELEPSDRRTELERMLPRGYQRIPHN